MSGSFPSLALPADETQRAFLELDLNSEKRFARTNLILTERRILHVADDGTRLGSWLLPEIASLERDDRGILGRLEIQGASGALAAFNYTLKHSSDASEFADMFELVRVGSDGSDFDAARAELAATGRGPRTVQRRHRSPLLRLLTFTKPHLKGVSLGLFLTLATTAVGLLPPYLTMPLVDRVLLAPPPLGAPLDAKWNEVLFLVFGLLLAAFGTWLLTWAQGWVLARVSERVSADLRNRTYSHLQSLGLEYFGGKRTGDLIARISHDTEYLCSFLSDKLVDFVTDILMIVGTAAVLIYLDPFLALASLLAFPPIAWLILKARSGLNSGFLRGGRVWDAMTNILADTIPGIRVVKAFSQEKREIERFSRANRRIVEANDRVNRLWTFFWPLVMFLTQIGLLVVWLAGAWQVLHHRITLGMLTAFIAYIGRFYTRVEVMSRMLTATERASVSAQRLFEILDRKPKIVDPVTPVPLETPKGELCFRQVSFRYGARTVLDQLDLTIAPGEMVGIVGHTGSGKSTIANLVCRFYDVGEGSLELDGVDIRKHKVEDFRRQVGIVLQESFLFFGTVIDNVTYGKPDASRGRVLAATRAARAHEFILRLSEGYDSLVGERGQSLSGGERQRLAIARALLVDPRILVLDEATSAVDTETERDIQKALDSLIAGRTTVAIAHRLSTLRKANRIIVLRRGKIVEVGSHDELLAKDGEYARLHRAQSQGQEKAGSAGEIAPPPVADEPSPPVYELSEIRLSPGSPGRLHLEYPGGESAIEVTPIRCFPLTDPDRHVALVDLHGHEIFCIETLSELSPELRALVESSFTAREFVPRILSIKSIEVAAGQSDWHVETDRGPTKFLLDQDDQLRRLPAGRFLITDAWGGRYLIENQEQLDSASRRELLKVA